MDISTIAIFLKVAEVRSFVEAGRRLAISASGIGKSIARLEDRLGVRLFHRSTRSVTLTTEGEIFLGRAKRIVAEFSCAEMELSRVDAAPSGRLKISLPLTTEPFLPALAEFKLAYPDVALEIEFDNRKVDIIEGGFDAVIRSGELTDSQLSARSLGRYRTKIVGTPAYFARKGTPNVPSDLKDHTCIHLRNRQTGKLIAWMVQNANGIEDALTTHDVICNTNEAQKYFVMCDIGIAYMWEFDVLNHINSGDFLSVLDDFMTEHSEFHLLWPSGRNIPSKLRVFIEFITVRSRLRKLSA